MSDYERTDGERDPLRQARSLIDAAGDEIDEIRLGPLDRNDRAALDRATQRLKTALARIGDVERGSRPPAEHRHPGSPRRETL
jgi:hypothetical protein